MEKQKESTISYSSSLIYIKQKSKIFKGYWIWSDRISELKNKLAVELIYNHKPIPEIYKFISIIMDSFTLDQLKKILKAINQYCYDIDNGYEYYLYCNVNDAIQEVIKHNGDIFVDYNKTIKEDCLVEK